MGSRISKSNEVVYDTIGQASAETGHEEWKISLARRSGCKAFRKGGRVERDGLNKFIAENPELFEKRPSLTKEEADIKLKEVKIERERLALERDKGNLISRAEVLETCKILAKHQQAVLRAKLESELAPKLVGKPILEVVSLLRGASDDVTAVFRRGVSKWK